MLKNIPKDFKIKLIGVNETIFERKDQTLIHEATFIYNIYLDLKTELLLDKVVYEQDEEINKKLDFKWIKLNELKHIDFRPKCIFQQITNCDFSFKHHVSGFNTKINLEK